MCYFNLHEYFFLKKDYNLTVIQLFDALNVLQSPEKSRELKFLPDNGPIVKVSIRLNSTGTARSAQSTDNANDTAPSLTCPILLTNHQPLSLERRRRVGCKVSLELALALALVVGMNDHNKS